MKDYSYALLVFVFVLASFFTTCFFIKHLPPIKVIIVNKPLGL